MTDSRNAFLASRRRASFLQTQEWQHFQEALGRSTKLLTLGEPITASALLIRHPLPFGQHDWFCPRGPVIADETIANEFFQMLEAAVRETGGMFFRFEPSEPHLIPRRSHPSIAIHPEHTLLLSLESFIDDLCLGMKPKWRYNLRVAQKRGVEVEVLKHPAAVTPFFELVKSTSSRHGIRSHTEGYYRTLMELLGRNDPNDHGRVSARLYVAKHRSAVVAAHLMIAFGDTVTYLHGASSYGHRDLMAPFLLHWQAISDAKAWGYRTYDFWGIAPEGSDEHHPWAGMTRFKLGFGGKRVTMPGTYDLPLRPLAYHLYTLVRRWRRHKRN